jgi:hypothetical protein
MPNPASTTTGNALCAHTHRLRHNDLGWFSHETICTDCGLSFDPDEEARLRSEHGTDSVAEQR